MTKLPKPGKIKCFSMSESTLAILLLNWNGIGETVACVDSLLKSKTSIRFDIYILDNGSREDEVGKLNAKYHGIENIIILPSPTNLGFTGGNNFLIIEARKRKNYEYLFLLNNDTEVPADFLEKFIAKVNHRVGIFGPQVRYFEKPNLIQSIGGKVNLWTGICKRLGDKSLADQTPAKDSEYETDYIFGCAFLVASSVIDNIGLLREDYFIYYEEVDYCCKARESGFSVRYLPVEMILHKDSVATRKVSGFHIYTMFRNRIYFLRRHASFFQFLFSFIYVTAYLVYFTFKYGVKEAKFLVEGTVDGVRGRTGNPMTYRTF